MTKPDLARPTSVADRPPADPTTAGSPLTPTGGPTRPDPGGAATPPPDAIAWHRRSADDVLTALGSSVDGLTPEQAAERLREVGPNELEDRGSKHPARILWEQLTAVMVVVLIGASLLSLALGKFLEAGTIGAIVILFALLGFFQEYRAERAIAALRAMAPRRCRRGSWCPATSSTSRPGPWCPPTCAWWSRPASAWRRRR